MHCVSTHGVHSVPSFFFFLALPPDVLLGHRDRFNGQFKQLKHFYYSSSNLQYFKYLVSIPPLPDVSPVFFFRFWGLGIRNAPWALMTWPLAFFGHGRWSLVWLGTLIFRIRNTHMGITFGESLRTRSSCFQSPPNFLVASDFDNYVTPKVTVHGEGSEAGWDTPPDSRSVVDAPLVLVDVTEPVRSWKYLEFQWGPECTPMPPL